MTAVPTSTAELEAELSAWLAARGTAARAIAPLPGDVSVRRYARVELESGESLIAARYPPEIAPAQERFERAGRLLTAAGVRVPRTHACDPVAGWSLVEDLGPLTLYDHGARGWPALAPYYESALDAAARIAALDPAAVAALGSAPLDRALLRRELEQTERLYLAPRGLLEGAAGTAFGAALDALCAALAAEAPVPCHRDFMARNLIPIGASEVGVLDFQDLRLGPPAYDLASLLNDSLFPPAAIEARWVRRARGGGAEDDLGYLRAVAQRALKAVGTYASFAARGQQRHLPLIAPTLARAAAALARLPETAASFERLRSRFAPLLPPEAIC